MYNRITVATLLELLSAFKTETPVVLSLEQSYQDGSVDHWRGLANDIRLDTDEHEEDSEVVKISTSLSLDMKSNRWCTVGELIDCLNMGIVNKIWTREHFVIVAKNSACWYLQHIKIGMITMMPADVVKGSKVDTVVVVDLDNYSEG